MRCSYFAARQAQARRRGVKPRSPAMQAAFDFVNRPRSAEELRQLEVYEGQNRLNSLRLGCADGWAGQAPSWLSSPLSGQGVGQLHNPHASLGAGQQNAAPRHWNVADSPPRNPGWERWLARTRGETVAINTVTALAALVSGGLVYQLLEMIP